MSENEQASQTLLVTYGNSTSLNEPLYHAVYIPEESLDNLPENSTKGTITI